MPLGQYISQKQRAYSVAEFCEAFGLSVPMFYKLKNKGRAPRIMKVGSRTLISFEAADKWRRDRERAARQKPTPS
jgi:predicted DNA-binding transcriptional regulator AlpA